jgi:hypothetical protein
MGIFHVIDDVGYVVQQRFHFREINFAEEGVGPLLDDFLFGGGLDTVIVDADFDIFA